MIVAGIRALEGIRLASVKRPRGRLEEESPVVAAAAAIGWRLLLRLAPPDPAPAPARRCHPAAAANPAGSASGWLRRQRWAALLVLGLLVAGAADGCELVPRNPRGARSAGSGTATTAAAGRDSPALLTGERSPVLGGGWREDLEPRILEGSLRPLFQRCHGRCPAGAPRRLLFLLRCLPRTPFP